MTLQPGREAQLRLAVAGRDVDVVDAVLSLELGVDDYLRKPLDLHELRAHIHALLRRVVGSQNSFSETFLRHGAIWIDAEQSEAFFNDNNLNLTKTEYLLLKLLLASPKRTFDRNEVLDHIWGQDFVGEPRTVDVHIRHLRSKLEDWDPKGIYIKTVRGRGWRLA